MVKISTGPLSTRQHFGGWLELRSSGSCGCTLDPLRFCNRLPQLRAKKKDRRSLALFFCFLFFSCFLLGQAGTSFGFFFFTFQCFLISVYLLAFGCSHVCGIVLCALVFSSNTKRHTFRCVSENFVIWSTYNISWCSIKAALLSALVKIYCHTSNT